MYAIFDYFAKRVVQAGVAPACISASEHEVRHDSQRADLFIEPDPARLDKLRPLGLLGRFCARVCSMEFFHGTPGALYVEACVAKILALRRKRRREKQREPVQWILVSGTPKRAMRDFGFAPARGWGLGVHASPGGLSTYIVVASELPVTRDTLLVRLLAGRGHVLQRAKDELRWLPKDAVEPHLTEEIMLSLEPKPMEERRWSRRELEEFRATMFPLTTARDKEWKEKAKQARIQGAAKGVADSLLSVYESRFGAVPKPIAKAVSSVRDRAVLDAWLRLVATASEEEIAAAVVAAKPAPAKPPATKRTPAKRTRSRAATARASR